MCNRSTKPTAGPEAGHRDSRAVLSCPARRGAALKWHHGLPSAYNDRRVSHKPRETCQMQSSSLLGPRSKKTQKKGLVGSVPEAGPADGLAIPGDPSAHRRALPAGALLSPRPIVLLHRAGRVKTAAAAGARCRKLDIRVFQFFT